MSYNKSDITKKYLIRAGEELLQREDYENVTVSKITKAVYIAKGTFFLYFKTKEELFLEILLTSYMDWFLKINTELESYQKDLTIDEFCRLMGGSFHKRTTFIKLVAITHTVIEQNVKPQLFREFMQFIAINISKTGIRIEQKLTFLKKGEGSDILFFLYPFLIGIFHISYNTPPGKNKKELGFEKDSRSLLVRHLKRYLNGLKYKNSPK